MPALATTAPALTAAAASADIAGQPAAQTVGGVANFVLDVANTVRVNARTAVAISRRANEMASAIDSILDERSLAALDTRDVLESFKSALVDLQEALRALARQSYVAQLLHQQRDRERLEALSATIKDAYDKLMIKLRLQNSTAAEALVFRMESMLAAAQEPARADEVVLEPSAHIPPRPALYFGRETETQTIVDSVLGPAAGRVAILGPPGIGKTTLSLSALHDPSVAAHFGTKRYFVPCDGADGTNSCFITVAEGLGMTAANAAAAKRALRDLLGVAPATLVLDNYESVWEPARQQTDAEELLQFLDSLPTLALLVTLRGAERPSGVRWNRPFLPPLAPLSDSAAQQVFVSIADASGADPVTETLLSLLGNVPLAIVLMANLAQCEPTATLLARWNELQTTMLIRGNGQHRLSSLDVSIRLSLEGARMRAAPQAQRLLGILSLLPHGVVDSDLELWNIDSSARGLSVLLRTALATRSEDRVRVLAPIRSFMLLHHSPSDDDTRSIYSHYFGLTELAKQSIELASQPEIIRGLTTELANIDFVIRYALEHSQTQDREAIQAVASLAFLYNEVCLGPGPQLLPPALAVAREKSYHDLCADLLLRWGLLSFNGAMPGDQESLLREAHDLHKRFCSTERVIASGLQLLHYLAPREAVVEARQLFEVAKSLKDYRRMAHVSDALSRVLDRLRKPVEAIAQRTRAITLIQLAINNGTHERQLGYYKYRLGVDCHKLGDLDRAEQLYLDAITIFAAARSGFGLTMTHTMLAAMFLDQGRTTDSLATVSRVLAMNQAPTFRCSMLCLVIAAQAHALEGNHSAAMDAVENIYQSRPADSFSAHELVCILIAQSCAAWSCGDFSGMHGVLAAARTRVRGRDGIETPEIMHEAEAHVLKGLGEVAYSENRDTDAFVYACTAATIFRNLSNKVDTAKSLVLLAEVADAACAELILSAVLPPVKRMGLSLDLSRAFLRSATIAKARGLEELARRCARDSLDTFGNIKGDWRIPLARRIAEN